MKTLLILVLSVLFSTACNAQIQNAESSDNGKANTAFSVGILPGSFGVSPSGGATYMIPLDLPAGRVGMKPDLALCYNSQQKIGNILGQGWSLTGFSAITRSNPTLYYNGGNDNIDFDNDELMLDGQHLIKIRDKEYRTELDVFSKIEEIDGGDNGKYFKVYAKNGMIMEYGNTLDSRQVYSGNNSDNIPLAWHLNKTTDRMGNSIDYAYFRDQDKGELHPISISYTGDITKTLGSTKITFDYSVGLINEKLQHTSYLEKNGQKYLNKNSWLLQKILISNFDGTKLLKEYRISYYEQKGVSKEFFVKYITLFNYENGIACPVKPTNFGWDFYYPAYQNYGIFESERIISNSSFKSIGLDLDGNHIDEIATYFNRKNEFTGESNKVIALYGPNTVNVELEVTGTFQNFYAIDWDSNGDDELLVVDNAGIKIYDYTGNTMNQVYTNSNIGYIYTGDITGDAINDIFIKQATSLMVLVGKRLPDGTFGYDSSSHSLPITINQSIRTVADINGDGNVEILCKGSANNSFSIWSFSAASGFTKINEFSITEWPTSQNLKVYYDDFNGDGKTDMSYLTEVNGSLNRFSCFSFGNNFTEPKIDNAISYPGAPSVVSDINNDGRADFVYLSFNPGALILKCYFTNPDGVSSEFQQTSVSCNTDFTRTNFSEASINANGTMGFILTSAKSENTDSPHDPHDRMSIQTFADMGCGNNVIDTITDGFGVKTQIKYTNLGTTGPLYSNFPVSKPRFKDNVVLESYIIGDNNAKWDWDQYTFNTPLIHLQGKGFLGFKETRVVSRQNNLLNISSNEVQIKNNKYFYPYPATLSTWSMKNGNQDKLLSETKNTVDFKVATPDALIFLPVVLKSFTKSWDNDAAHSYKGIQIENQSIGDIDNYGNVLNHKILMDEFEVGPNPVNRCSWEKTTVTSYKPANETLWLVGRPDVTEITTYHKPEEEIIDPTYTTKISYEYYVPGESSFPLLKYKETLPNNNEDLKTQNWYAYDPLYGNLIRETIKATANGAPPERITEYAYGTDPGYMSRFLTSKTIKDEDGSGNDQVTTFTYDPVPGRLLTSKNLNSVGTTTYSYDIQGRLIKTNQPDGTSNEIVVNWSALLTELVPPPTALYYVLSYKNLSSGTNKWNKSYTFYDKYCRPLRIVTQGLNGEYINIDNNFDIMGRVAQVSEPYAANGPPSQWTTSGYDDLGRLVSQTLPTGAINSTEFKGLTTRISNAPSGIWKETTVNVTGSVDIVKDPASGSINYNYDAASRIRSIYAQGAPTYFEYDDAGNRTKVIDPDAGITLSTYNAFGELVTQTDARGSMFTNTYDVLGRIKTSSLTPDNTLTTYNYNGSSEAGFGQIKNLIKTINGSNETKIEYSYDLLGRTTSKTEIFEGISYTFGYNYSTLSGMLEYYTYPSLYKIKYEYDAYGYMKKVIENSTLIPLWTANTANARGQLTDYTLGNGLATHKDFDSYGFPGHITTKNVATQNVLQDLNYSFDIFTGNLNSKTELISSGYSLYETYEYDPILKSRLTSWQVQNGSPKYSLQYADNGNILTKSDVTQPTESQYTYTSAGPHAVTGITLPTAGYLASATAQTISYTGFNKVQQISQIDRDGMMLNKLSIEYGPDDQRIKSILFNVYDHSIIVLKTKYFFDDFEIEIDNTTGQARQLHYLSASSGIFAIIEIKNNTTTPFYIHTDYLGNYNLITSGTGAKLETLSFDPWGRRRHPTNWTYTNVPTTFLFDRGYTGHEHLDKFGLINMNGRVFDPVLARFLSPDPVLQDLGNSQSHNRYSYCLNNPLKFTDPSGFKPQFDPYDPPPWNTWNPGGGPGGSNDRWRPANDAIFFCSSASAFINTYGAKTYNQLYFNNVTLPSILSNSEINKKDPEQGKAAEYIDAGFIVTPIDAFGRKIYVASLGAPGNISTLPNGGIIFDNKTSSEVWGLTIIINNGQGDGHSFMDNANFAFNAGDLYYSAKGEALHNELYWVQKNGKIRSTASIGNNYLLKRSYNLTGQLAEGAKIASRSFAYAGAAVSGINMVSDFRFANTFDFAMGMTTFIPGVGWAVSGVYFISNVAVESYTGKTIGEHLELQLNKIGQ